MALRARISRQVHRPRTLARAGDSPKHIAWLVTLPCLLCGRYGCDPHHLKTAVDGQPKGMGRTALDRWALPVCRKAHDYLEAGDDEQRLIVLRIDGRAIAQQLWSHTGETEAAERILFRARQTIPRGAFIPCFSDVLPSRISGVNA
jgi:hypothetical protein